MPSCVVYPTRSAFKYVNPEGPSMDVKDVTDRAAQTMFLTEIFRGVCAYFWYEIEDCVHCIMK